MTMTLNIDEVEVINALVEPFVQGLWDKNVPATTGGIDRGVMITAIIDGKLRRIAVTMEEKD